MKKEMIRKEIVIRASLMTCRLAKTVIEQAKQGPVTSPVVLFRNGNTWEAYLEEVDPDKKIGIVSAVSGSSDLSELDDLAKGQYSLLIDHLDGTNCLVCTFSKEKASAVKAEVESEELKNAWQEKIAGGVLTEDDRKFITWIWNNNKVDPLLRLRAVRGYHIYKDIYGNRIPIIRPAHPYVNADPAHEETPYDGSIFAEVVRQALDRQPVNLVGDKSVGKNVCAKTAAYTLMMPYYESTMSEDTMRSDVVAERSISDEAQKHLTKDLVEAGVAYQIGQDRSPENKEKFMEYQYWKTQGMTMQLGTSLGEMGKWAFSGGLFMMNEKNLARVNVVESIINTAAEDNNPHMEITGYGNVYLNPDCVLMASENANYAGTNISNDAVDSRFGMILFPYPAHVFDQLKVMTESDCGKGCLKDSYYKSCDKLYVYLRKQVHAGTRSNGTLSLRSFGRALKSVVKGGGYCSLHSQLLIQLQSLCKTDEEQRAIADDIHALVGNL